jgi:hypothetical protein
MLLFGSINNGGGANYWVKDILFADIISLNQAQSANGMIANTAQGNRFVINNDNLSGVPLTGSYQYDIPTGIDSLNAVIDDRANGGGFNAIFSGSNNSVSSFLKIDSNDAIAPVVLYSTDIGQNDEVTANLNYLNYSIVAKDLNLITQNQGDFFITKFSSGFNFLDTPNSITGSYRWDADIMEVEDAGNARVFGVRTNGEIQTNQAIPHNNTINTLTWDLPIYDTNGNLLGYIKVYT